MSWMQFRDLDLDYEPVRGASTAQVRKRIWDQEQQQFLEVRFTRVFINVRSELERAIDQHREEHGAPQYQGAWWHDDRSIWLRESLATFWLLKNSK